jgi:hypothetical protein
MEATASKTAKHRSPSYPAIDLARALERAEQLADAAGKHEAPVAAAMTAWGYSPKSSGGLLSIAALKKFGLLTDTGKREARKVALTPLAQELLVYGTNRDSDEWLSRVRTAALTPAIHRELWEKYEGELPSDSVITPHLQLERRFSKDAAREMLKEFRSTIAFARLSETDGSVSENEEDNDSDSEANSHSEMQMPEGVQEPKPIETSKREQQRTIQVTYSPTDWALVQGSFPMSEADWESFIEVLQGMKRGLVTRDQQ